MLRQLTLHTAHAMPANAMHCSHYTLLTLCQLTLHTAHAMPANAMHHHAYALVMSEASAVPKALLTLCTSMVCATMLWI